MYQLIKIAINLTLYVYFFFCNRKLSQIYIYKVSNESYIRKEKSEIAETGVGAVVREFVKRIFSI